MRAAKSFSEMEHNENVWGRVLGPWSMDEVSGHGETNWDAC